MTSLASSKRTDINPVPGPRQVGTLPYHSAAGTPVRLSAESDAWKLDVDFANFLWLVEYDINDGAGFVVGREGKELIRLRWCP